jgi:hypothetical protein
MPQGGFRYTPAESLDAEPRAEGEEHLPRMLGYHGRLAVPHGRATEGVASRGALEPGPGLNGARIPPPLPRARESLVRPAPSGRKGITIAPIERVHRVPLILPRPDRSYRLGTVIASVLLTAGAISAAGGAVLLSGFWDVQILELMSLPRPAFLDGDGAALSLVAGGVVLTLVGELLRAFFAQARATRELASIARARAEREAAEIGAHPLHD